LQLNHCLSPKLQPMKKVLFIVTIAGWLFMSCGSNSQQPSNAMGGGENDKGIDVPKEMLAVAKDVVCGMSLKTIADTAMVNGKAYPFCSKECKEEFKAHPEKYVIN
jgi:YHS domain-containing protein